MRLGSLVLDRASDRGPVPDPYCDVILPGVISVRVVAETASFLAFHHPSPSFRAVQIMVIPKLHIESVASLARESDETLGELMRLIANLAADVSEAQGSARVLTNVGALQHSRHLHWHVVSDPERQHPPAEPVDMADEEWRRYWSEQRWLR